MSDGTNGHNGHGHGPDADLGFGQPGEARVVFTGQPLGPAQLVQRDVLPLLALVGVPQPREHLACLRGAVRMGVDVAQGHLSGARRLKVSVGAQQRFGVGVAELVYGLPHVL